MPVLGGADPMGEGPWVDPEQHAGKGAEPVAVAGDGEREGKRDQTESIGGVADGESPY